MAISSFWGIVFYFRNIILLGVTTKKTPLNCVLWLRLLQVLHPVQGLGFRYRASYSGLWAPGSAIASPNLI